MIVIDFDKVKDVEKQKTKNEFIAYKYETFDLVLIDYSII